MTLLLVACGAASPDVRKNGAAVDAQRKNATVHARSRRPPSLLEQVHNTRQPHPLHQAAGGRSSGAAHRVDRAARPSPPPPSSWHRSWQAVLTRHWNHGNATSGTSGASSSSSWQGPSWYLRRWSNGTWFTRRWDNGTTTTTQVADGVSASQLLCQSSLEDGSTGDGEEDLPSLAMDGLDATSINCSVSYRWMQQTNASVILKPPVVTNSTIEMMIRLPVTLAKLAGAPAQVTHPPAAKAPEGFVVLGLTIQRPSDAVVIPAYAATNILSFFPRHVSLCHVAQSLYSPDDDCVSCDLSQYCTIFSPFSNSPS